MRADAGFFSYDMIAAIGAHGASYSITIPQNAKVKAAIAAIDDDDWASIEYTRGGEAQVAETTITAGRRGDKLRGDDGAPAKLRLIVRRTRLLGAQPSCGPTGDTTASSPTESTSTPVPPTPTTAHATVELAIRDLKERRAQPLPLRTVPRQRCSPAACSRTTSPAGPPASDAPTPQRQLTVAATIAPPAPHSAGPPRQPQRPPQLRLPLNWPWDLHHRPGTQPALLI